MLLELFEQLADGLVLTLGRACFWLTRQTGYDISCNVHPPQTLVRTIHQQRAQGRRHRYTYNNLYPTTYDLP